MHFSRFLPALSLFLTPILSSPTPLHSDAIRSSSKDELPTYNNHTIFQSPANYTVPGTLYARTVQLSNGDILATWENYSPEPPLVYFPIYKSSDYGLTWKEISRVEDQVLGFGLRYQPVLYVLPRDFGGFKKGTVLLSGSAIPTDLSSTHLELYASRDQGYTWEFVSHIASGGEATPVNGFTPIWEPFLLLYKNELICYYSDQRDPLHGQKLVHQTTTDGRTWGPLVNDVRYDNYTSRPGMPTVAQLHDGNWIMTYEYGGGPSDGVLTDDYLFPVFYRVSNDPRTFDASPGLSIVTNDADRTVPEGSPYVVVTHDGRVLVSCGTKSEIFVHHAGSKTAPGGVDTQGWTSEYTGERISYTRSLTLLTQADQQHHRYSKKDPSSSSHGGDQDEEYVLIAGGGPLPPATANKVTVGLVDISDW